MSKKSPGRLDQIERSEKFNDVKERNKEREKERVAL